MRLGYGPEEERFRAELLEWLEAHYPPEAERQPWRASSADKVPWMVAWQRLLFHSGWLVPGWPPELGGRNASAGEQMIYFDEMSRRGIPRTCNPQGIGIIAPSLNDDGTLEQKERFLLPTLRAEISWCVGMSEPNAGSDLASLQTRAVLDGDEFVVNGQKIWTSGAHHADWCMCYVRTDPSAPKHKGISALIIDTTSPGVIRRPFPNLTGRDDDDFNEVFFDDVRVPAENLLGELNDGWRLTQGSLAHERAMLWIDYACAVDRIVEEMLSIADVEGEAGRIGDDPQFRDAVAASYVDSQGLLTMGYRGFAKFQKGRAAPEHSLLKLAGSEALQRAALAGGEALGALGLDRTTYQFDYLGVRSWMMQYLWSFNGTIPGGTSEIQRNIIAERVLGLPRV